MKTRADLQDALEAIFAKWASDIGYHYSNRRVYYQPPQSINLSYPCILYDLDMIRKIHADDIGYKKDYRYSITIIDKDPDSTLHEYVDALPYASFNRAYKADNLYHYVYTLYLK